MNDLRLKMKNASDGSSKNPDGSVLLPKPSVDNSKSKQASPCVNKPIFRRKLIEKYSTARYNINTKRVSVRKSSTSRTLSDDKISVVPSEDPSSCVDKDLKSKTRPVLAISSSNNASLPVRKLNNEIDSLKSSKSHIKLDHVATSGTKIADKKDSSSPPVPSEPQITSNKSQDSRLTRKRKFTSEPVPSSKSKTTWTIAPKMVYNQLRDLYQGTTEIKTEEEPTKETKKRTRSPWIKKRTPKKPLSPQKKVTNDTHFDPYIECLKEADTQSSDASIGQNDDKFGFVMYLGVNRPLFPLVYRNLRVLNNSNDATITDFWAEFALSTLVVKKADEKYTPILVPVKDPELWYMVSDCIEKIVQSNKSNVSGALSVSNDAVENSTNSQVRVKQEDNDDVPEKKSRYKLRSSGTVPETSKTSFKKSAAKKLKRISNVESTTPTRRRKFAEKELEKNSDIESEEKESEETPDVKRATSRGRKSAKKKDETIPDVEPAISRSRKSTSKEPEKIPDIKPSIPRGRKSKGRKSAKISEIEAKISPPNLKLLDKELEKILDIELTTIPCTSKSVEKSEIISETESTISPPCLELMENEPDTNLDIEPTTILRGRRTISPPSLELMEKEPETNLDIKPTTILRGRRTISPPSLELMEKEPDTNLDIKPTTILRGRRTISPPSLELMEKKPETNLDIKPTTILRGRRSIRKKSKKIFEIESTISPSNCKKEPDEILDIKPATTLRSRKSAEKKSEKIPDLEPTISRDLNVTENEPEKISDVEPTTPTRSQAPAPKSSPEQVPIDTDLTLTSPLTPSPAPTLVVAAVPSSVSDFIPSPASVESPIPTPTLVPAPITSPVPALTSPASIKSPIPTPKLIPGPVTSPISAPLSSPTPMSTPTPTPAAAPEPTPVKTATSAAATPTTSLNSELKPKNRAVRTKKPVFEEKKILKKFGYKECQVTIPKLSDTLIKYLSAGNYSNESAELSDPTERELIEETDDFGLIQCTRTDGIIIDYVKRNRSLVYFYKLKKMLDFQKTNNKYFVCCDYMLIDRTDVGDEEIDIISIQEEDDDSDELDRSSSTESAGPRNSRNPNDLFKTSKISEFKNKSNRISWVKNHDLKYFSDVKWLLISLDKYVASLSHASGCVLRYRLLFEIIYRAELSKKVICCEVQNPSTSSTSDNDPDSDKLTFGVYAFPGLCDKVLAGPYLLHEDHQFSASIRTNDGSFEHAYIRTLEEKENFPKTEDSTTVKHINAKWWSGEKTADWTGQYLNFFFNPSAMKCAQPLDKFCQTKIIDDHPCQNYHSYVTGRESNLVLFHDDTNHIERTVTSTKSSTSLKTDNKSDQESKVAAPSIPPKSSRNLRKMPRRDYSRLVTDDMAVPAKTKNLEFHIADVKSLRTPRYASGERSARTKRNRYHESPQMHILNERMRRLEFRNRKNDLVSVLETRPSSNPAGNTPSLVSILNQAKEIITYLEVDNDKLYEEGKRLRLEQSVMMRRFLALLRSFDLDSPAYKKGMMFVVAWKQIKANHRTKLINILGQNFDKQTASKATKTTESSRNVQVNIKETTIKETTSPQRPTLHSTRRPVLYQSILKNRTATDEYKRDIQKFKEDTMQRSEFRKQKRQKMKNTLRKRNQVLDRSMTDSLDCEISAEVVCENGKLSDPLSSSHILDSTAEVPILVPNVPSGDLHAVDPLADNDSDDSSPPPDGYSTKEKKEPPHPLYYEHSYCSNEDEPPKPKKPSNGPKMHLPQIKNVYSQNPAYRFIGPFGNSYRAPVFPSMTPSSMYRPRRPVFSNAVSLLPPRRTHIRTRMPVTKVCLSSHFEMKMHESNGENIALDLLDNGQIFARLNIAKINNGKRAKSTATPAGGAGIMTSNGSTRPTTTSEIITIIRRFLTQMGKTSTTVEPKDYERIKHAKRKHIVRSLTSFISRFESRSQPVEDAGYSSSHTSNSDKTSPPNVTEIIDLESGYSSRSEESCDYEPNTNKAAVCDSPAESQLIENIVLDDDDDDEIESQGSVQVQEQREQEPVEIHIPELEEQVIPEDEFITEQEEEELICEEEFIEEEEEEEIVEGSSTLEGMNDVDAAMRDNRVDGFTDSEDSTESAVSFMSDDSTNVGLHLENNQLNGNEGLRIPKPMPKMVYRPNQFTIVKSKNKFVPNIMKTPTKIVVNSTSTSDHLSRIQVKPSVGLVKLSPANMQLTTNEACPTTSSGSSDSIIKRLWYSPVTKTNQTDTKVQKSKIDDIRNEKLVDEDDSNEEKGPSIEKDNSGTNRILIKSFANHDKFKEAFVSNVDKLLIPKS